MTLRSGQMPMALPLPPVLDRASFVAGPCNAQALAQVLDQDWPQGKLVLTGPAGAGKTHLAHIWAQQTGIPVVTPAALGDPVALGKRGAVVLDDAHLVAGDGSAQAGLFHLHNLLQAQGGRLLICAPAPVRDWGLTLPDLLTRLQAASHVALLPPDDATLAAVLAKLFTDRQVSISDALIPFLLPRMERSYDGAQRLVAALDAAALARHCRISRALAQDVLRHCAEGP
jgi:chromosomal replication initiation ATPase DnaA